MRNMIWIGLLIGRKRLLGLSAVRSTAAICTSVNGAYSVVPIKLFNTSLMIIVIKRENWEIHTRHHGFDKIREVCVCVEQRREDWCERPGDGSIYRRKNNVYFVLVSITNFRIHNAMVLAFRECFSELVDCDKVKWV